jgi:hypothetical protein
MTTKAVCPMCGRTVRVAVEVIQVTGKSARAVECYSRHHNGEPGWRCPNGGFEVTKPGRPSRMIA